MTRDTGAPDTDTDTFSVGVYTVRRLAKAGLWLVTADSSFELGALFWRAQEMYESPNHAFRAKPPALLDYIRWYCEVFSEDHSFTYYTDYVGYNLPASAVAAALSAEIPDTNRYDALFARVAAGVEARQAGDYYLIGARTSDKAVTEHEIAHGMFYLLPKYKDLASKLVNTLPEKEELFALLRKEGYSDEVLVDEAQAYLATGLFEDLMHLEQVRHPFMKLYKTHKKKLIKPRRRKNEKLKGDTASVLDSNLLQVAAA